MSPEGVAFLVVLAAVGAIPGAAAFAAWRASRRMEAKLGEVLNILRARQGRRPVGFALPRAGARDEAS